MRLLKLIVTCALIAGCLTVATPASAVTAHWFALITPNTAVSPSGGDMSSPGDQITVSGAGRFNAARATVIAGGYLVHRDASGAVVCSGPWWATAFVGFQHGALSPAVSHYCTTMQMTMTGLPMTVTSAATTSAGVTQPTGGAVAFW